MLDDESVKHFDKASKFDVTVPFNHMNELELSNNCAKRHVSAQGRFVSAVS